MRRGVGVGLLDFGTRSGGAFGRWCCFEKTVRDF